MPRTLLVTILTFAAALGAAPSANAIIRELGQEEPFPAASCPDNCQAIGRVTGFQVRQGDRRNPVKVPRDGKIVAFTLKLGDPNAEQIQFFNTLFGGVSQARLAVLRNEPIRRRTRRGVRLRSPNRYRLVRQSEVFNLEAYFGSTPSFVLDRPLTALKGEVLGLTVPTWVPAFAVGLGDDQTWRSSRPRGACDDVSQPSAHMRRNTHAIYYCFYRTARLLYSATWVRDPEPTNQEDGDRR